MYLAGTKKKREFSRERLQQTFRDHSIQDENAVMAENSHGAANASLNNKTRLPPCGLKKTTHHSTDISHPSFRSGLFIVRVKREISQVSIEFREIRRHENSTSPAYSAN